MVTKPPKSGRRRKILTPKRRKLIQELSKGKNLTEAGLAAGFSKKCPSQSAHQALSLMSKTMPEMLDEAGLTDFAIIEKYLKPLLNATETKFFPFRHTKTEQVEQEIDGPNGTKIKQKTPVETTIQTIQTKDVIAWGPRRDGLDILCRMKGTYAASSEENRGPGVQVVILDCPRPDRSQFVVPPMKKPANTQES